MDDAAALFEGLDRELWIVTARAGAESGGLVATFVSDASIVRDFPRVIVGLAHQHRTWELVEASDALALHLIGEEHIDWVWRFGLRSGRDEHKLQGLRVGAGRTGSPVLLDALGWLDCRVESRMDTGDRTVYLAEVIDARQPSSAPPLTLKRLLQLAPAAKLRELNAQREHDSHIDAEAIRIWRRHRQGEFTPP
jgi:flavin reductase (DIM6/NTAB) family NADH-FMN oxidoreductase RutF